MPKHRRNGARLLVVEAIVESAFEAADSGAESVAAGDLFEIVAHVADAAGFVDCVVRALAVGGRLNLTVARLR